MTAETAARRPTPLTLRAYGYWALQYRRTWRGSIVSSVLNPVLFLAAMGIGLGGIVDRNGTAPLGGHSYLSFLAPGLLAGTAMQTAVAEATYPVLASIKWVKVYSSQLATPLRVVDVLYGHLIWMAVRIAMTAGIFMLVMALFGVLGAPAALLALPAAVLTGLAFATPVTAYAARCESDSGFAVIGRFVVIPLFLFSGTFFPISQLPALLRPIAYATPLWHGVALTRGLALGDLGAAAAVGHVAYLAALTAIGVVLARWEFSRRLEP